VLVIDLPKKGVAMRCNGPFGWSITQKWAFVVVLCAPALARAALNWNSVPMATDPNVTSLRSWLIIDPNSGDEYYSPWGPGAPPDYAVYKLSNAAAINYGVTQASDWQAIAPAAAFASFATDDEDGTGFNAFNGKLYAVAKTFPFSARRLVRLDLASRAWQIGTASGSPNINYSGIAYWSTGLTKFLGRWTGTTNIDYGFVTNESGFTYTEAFRSGATGYWGHDATVGGGFMYLYEQGLSHAGHNQLRRADLSAASPQDQLATPWVDAQGPQNDNQNRRTNPAIEYIPADCAPSGASELWVMPAAFAGDVNISIIYRYDAASGAFIAPEPLPFTMTNFGQGYDMAYYNRRIFVMQGHTAQRLWSARTAPVTVYVPSTQYPTIQAGIDAAESGDQVVVANGIYSGVGNKDLDFRGKAITVRSASGDPVTCMIDCMSNGRGFHFHSGETTASVVSGFTIRHGSVLGYPYDPFGGGVYCTNSSSPIVINCTISENTGVTGGGLSCVDSSSPTLVNCTISTNTASAGGGLFCDSSSCPTLINCTISGNTVSGTSARGGGVYSQSSNPTLNRCTIYGNTSSQDGGGVYCSSSAPALNDCTVAGNKSLYGSGGGVCCDYYAGLILTNCTITANMASSYGGALYCGYYASVMLTNCTINGNGTVYGFGAGEPAMQWCVRLDIDQLHPVGRHTSGDRDHRIHRTAERDLLRHPGRLRRRGQYRP